LGFEFVSDFAIRISDLECGMLPERVAQLLTAYIDGELNERQRQAAERLVGQSAEARALLQQLREDAKALRQLPRRKLDDDFSQRVLRAISEQRPNAGRIFSAQGESWEGIGAGQGRGARFAERTGYPTWVGVAAAAAVLLVAVLSSYFYFMLASPSKKDALPVAKNEPAAPEKAPEVARTNQAKHSANPPSEAPKPVEPEESAAVHNVKNEKSPVAETPPSGDRIEDSDPAVDATPTPRLEVFKKLDEVNLALALPLGDLDRPRQQERLRERLKEDTAFHLDVVCSETARGLERLEAAFKAQGIKLTVDQAAQNRWKRGLKTNYALYSEDVTAEELTKILQQLGNEEKKAGPKRRFDQVIIHHLTPSNQKELCTLLGVDPKTIPAKSKTPLGVDIRKPLSESTAEQVADSLAGKGTPRPKPGEPVEVKKPLRQALVLSYNPLRVRPSSSKEIKSFLDSRQDRRAGTLQILLVLRGS
jgi:anti-sigma factor RsiW